MILIVKFVKVKKSVLAIHYQCLYTIRSHIYSLHLSAYFNTNIHCSNVVSYYSFIKMFLPGKRTLARLLIYIHIYIYIYICTYIFFVLKNNLL